MKPALLFIWSLDMCDPISKNSATLASIYCVVNFRSMSVIKLSLFRKNARFSIFAIWSFCSFALQTGSWNNEPTKCENTDTVLSLQLITTIKSNLYVDLGVQTVLKGELRTVPKNSGTSCDISISLLHLAQVSYPFCFCLNFEGLMASEHCQN